MKQLLANVLRYLLQGVVIISPFLITFGLAYYVFDFVDSMIPGVPRGIGFVIAITLLIAVGYLGSRLLFGRLLLDLFDRIIEKIPGLKVVYTAVKDFADGFVGEKRKFTNPVLVKMSEHPVMYRVGFITQEDLTSINLPGNVMVYMPHAYAISGFHYILDREHVQPLDMDASDAMKLAVSGGVAGFHQEEEEA
jgi:uncharacterized membrane protein